MAATLWQLIYVSRSTRQLTIPEIMDLERISNSRNTAMGLTGMLLFDGVEFVQAIEGPEMMLRETLARIAADTRHDELVVAVDEAILTRQFGNWQMKCRHLSSPGAAEEAICELSDDLVGVADPNVRALFLGFARRAQARQATRLRGEHATAETRALDAHLRLLLERTQAALNQMQAFRDCPFT